MLNEYYWNLANVSAEISGLNARFIYSQWVHESTNDDNSSEFYGQPFKSDMAREYNNLGGLTQEAPNDTPQPDGLNYYMQFATPEDYADYFGRYLKLYEEDGIYEANDIPGYAAALKHGGYFGDTLENYISGMTSAYNEAFGGNEGCDQ